MPIEVVAHSPALRDAVEDFNRRMREGGGAAGMYVDSVPDWVPKRRSDQKVWREYYLALEDNQTVRGGYALKPQQWLIGGELRTVTDWQGPFSEAAYHPKYRMLALRLMRDMLQRQPLLYAWGSYGRAGDPMTETLRKTGWRMHPTPLCLRVLNPYRFLRLNRYLRREPKRAHALDALALSGVGSVGLRALHLALRAASLRLSRARAEHVTRFDDFADGLWERCRTHYTALAVRDADVMNTLLPGHGWPPGMILRVTRGTEDIGWAVVMDTPMRGDVRFGDLRVGSVIDCLALPADAFDVIAAATRFLAARGVDIIVSNQAHPAWARAFGQNGYVVLKAQRYFVVSPELQKALAPFEDSASGLHMTAMDGHGPMML